MFRQLARHLNPAKSVAGHVFNQATRAGGAIDKGIHWAHKAYNIISPALQQFGVPTAITDQVVNRGYDAYNQLRDKVVKGGSILKQTHKQISALNY